MAQTKRHDTSALMMQNNSSQKTVYPTRSRTVPKQREKEMEKLLPPITPNTKKLNAYDVPSGGSRDLSYRANSPGNQSIRIKSDPQSRARSNHKKSTFIIFFDLR